MPAKSSDAEWMEVALQLAHQGANATGGGPFGAIIVKEGKIIGRGYNQVTSKNDPTAHAEIVAIREACHFLQAFHLDDCRIYCSCEPCPMCLGAIYWSRLSTVYYAANRQDAAAAGFDDQRIYTELCGPGSQRSIKNLCLYPTSGQRVFDTWKNNPNKIPY